MQVENDASRSVGDRNANAVQPDRGRLYANADLIPPAELLFDGSSSVEEFVAVGEGFTGTFLLQRAGLRPDERVLESWIRQWSKGPRLGSAYEREWQL